MQEMANRNRRGGQPRQRTGNHAPNTHVMVEVAVPASEMTANDYMLVAQTSSRSGEHREAAEFYLKAYFLEVSDPLSRKWYSAAHFFFSAIEVQNERDGYRNATIYIKVLEKWADSNVEPSVVRAKAAVAAAALHLSKWNLQLAAEFYRLAIAICNSASNEEKSAVVVFTGVGTVKEVGEILSRVNDTATMQLDCLITRAQSSSTSPSSIYTDRVTAGRECCDTCGKTRAELGVTHINCCKRCGMVYYCSLECQREKWKFGGHKEACRKLGYIEEGDVMVHVGVASGPELNGKLVHAIRSDDSESNHDDDDEDANGPDKWIVKLHGEGDHTITVSADNLIHI